MKDDLNEIIDSVLTIKNTLEILKDFCFYNEENSKLVTVSSLIEILENECDKILDRY